MVIEIELAVVAGFAMVVPVVLGVPPLAWCVAAASAAASMAATQGSVVGVAGAVPVLIVAAVELARHLRRTSWSEARLLATVLDLGPRAFAAVAAGAFVQSRAGIRFAGIEEPIVLLTSVHFTYAGVAALSLAGSARAAAPGRLADAAVVLVAVAPPVVATGFVTGLAVAQVGGAVLMSVGVWCVASLHLREAVRSGHGVVRALFAVSGLAPWVPMVLAVAWAAAQHWAVAAMSVADLVRTHGAANSTLFVGAGLAARWLAGRHGSVADGPGVAMRPSAEVAA